MRSPVLNNKKVKSLMILLLFALVVSGCKKSAICDCFKGTGSEITQTRTSGPFHEVDLNNKVDLHVHYDSVYRITVTAGEKLIDKVTTEINNGVLTIDNKNKCNWVRNFNNKFSVDLYTPEIETLQVHNSSGNIYFEDMMKTESFRFESWASTGDYMLKLNCSFVYLALQTGSAALKAEGKTGVGYLWNSGSGRFDALKLQADDIYSTNAGTNDLLLFPEIRLEATIRFSGNIYIKGRPPIQQLQYNGTGKFIVL